MIESRTIVKELKVFVGKFDTSKEAAAALKVTPAQLSSTLNGKVNVIPEKILKKLGYKSALVYLPLKPAKNVPAQAPATQDAHTAPATQKSAQYDASKAKQPPTATPETSGSVQPRRRTPVEQVEFDADAGTVIDLSVKD